MPASFESWVDREGAARRVLPRRELGRARGGIEGIEPGATVYVLAADGNCRRVSEESPGSPTGGKPWSGNFAIAIGPLVAASDTGLANYWFWIL